MSAQQHCEVCGTTFTAKRSTARFCGDTCRQAAHRGAQRSVAAELAKAAKRPPRRFKRVEVEGAEVEDVQRALDAARGVHRQELQPEDGGALDDSRLSREEVVGRNGVRGGWFV